MKTQTNHLWVTLVMMALLYAATTATTTAGAQVRPLPPLSFDSLSQTYHGRLTTTLHRLFVRKDELNRYVTKDEAANHVTTTALASELSRYITKDEAANHVTTSDARLSDARTPKGTAGGDLVGSYPNPTIKSSVNLSGSPTATTPSSSDNSTRIATTAHVQANRYTHPIGNGYNHIPSGGSSGQILRYSSAGAAYWSNYPTCSDLGAASSSHSHSNATTSSAGFMSSSDKTALDNAMPKSGGTFTGNVKLQTGGSNYGSKLNFGDGDYVYIHEDTDDHLTLKASSGINVLTNTNGISDNGVRVYSPNNKPSPAAIGAPRIVFAGAVSSVGTYTSHIGNVSAICNSMIWHFKITGVDLKKCVALVTPLIAPFVRFQTYVNMTINGISLVIYDKNGNQLRTDDASCLFSIMCFTCE